jgi:hypothetical protein
VTEEVEFFFGLGSRYSYLAFTHIVRIETSHSCIFIRHSDRSHDARRHKTGRDDGRLQECIYRLNAAIGLESQERGVQSP